ncbi:MAG: hypothetical protein DRJ98_08795 [Thermoprotei archaeon]|nr:MAG: hypothetical protein DRJ98_08795 [Thermoprotei archaeon]RLG93630.1 MAG: hypothetical protein DRO29_07490 [Candidatus Bathyarchaeota archaeon]
MSKREREVLEALRELGVWSHRKRKELAGILLHHDPPHIKRVYLGGFLLYALGMSVEEATNFIERYSVWYDYRRETTLRNLRGIHKRKGSSNGPKSDGSKSSGLTFNKSEVLRGYERDLEEVGTVIWRPILAGNGYPIGWEKIILLG